MPMYAMYVLKMAMALSDIMAKFGSYGHYRNDWYPQTALKSELSSEEITSLGLKTNKFRFCFIQL